MILPVLTWAQVPTYQVSVSEVPLMEIIKQLESEHGIFFSYQPAQIKEVQVTVVVETNNLEECLTQLLTGTGFTYTIIAQDYVVIKPSEAEPQITGVISPPPTLSMYGQVLDSATGTPLPFASVYLASNRRGTYTNELGEFRLRSHEQLRDTLVVSFLGYAPYRLPINFMTTPPKSFIYLAPKDLMGEAVQITDYLTDGITLGEHGNAAMIQPRRVGALPGQVEPDVLRTIRFLPGVATPDGEVSNLYIRGGKPDQNLVMWEDIPIYQTGHFFGMVSAFNPYIMSHLKVYRGGQSASYGGRISGMVDMRSPGSELDEQQFGLGTNLTHVYSHGLVPIGNGKGAIVYSARQSLTDFWQSPTFRSMEAYKLQDILFRHADPDSLPPDFTRESQTSFQDAHLKGSLQLTQKDQLEVAAFWSRDFFHQRTEDPLAIQLDSFYMINQGLKLAWKRHWLPGFRIQAKWIDTKLDYQHEFGLFNTGNGSIENNRSSFTANGVQERQLHVQACLDSLRGWQLEGGYQYVQFQVSDSIGQTAQQQKNTDLGVDASAQLHVGYATLRSPKYQKLGMELGLRYNQYSADRKNPFWEPRVQLWYQPNRRLEFNAHYGQYVQFLSQLVTFRGEDLGLELPIWVLSSRREVIGLRDPVRVPVLQSTQYQVGGRFYAKGWMVEAQAYYKQVTGLSSLAFGFGFAIDPKDLISRGSAEMRGIDLMIRKRWNTYRTWLSYSISQVTYRFDSIFSAPFAAEYDQRHVLRWAHQWSVGKWELAGGIALSSGRPYSVVDSVSREGNAPNPPIFSPFYDLSAYNNQRLSLQHRLDFSVLYHFLPVDDQGPRGQIGFSCFNVYNQSNYTHREYYLLFRPQGSGSQPRPPQLRSILRTDLGFTPNLVVKVFW